MCPVPLNHCFRMGRVIKIKISPVPENLSKMLPKRLPKRSSNRHKRVSGRLSKNTSKRNASNKATCYKAPPKMDPKNNEKSMKKRIWAHLPPLSLTLASLGRLWGYPRHGNVPKCEENVSAKPTSKGKTTMLSENVSVSKFL